LSGAFAFCENTMLARYSKTLMDVSTAVTVDTVGDAISVKGSQGDDVTASSQGFLAVFQLTAAGGTSPTVDASVQTSFDGGDTWHTVAEMTQLTVAGEQNEMKAISTLGGLVRATLEVGGTEAPDVTGSILLASSGRIH